MAENPNHEKLKQRLNKLEKDTIKEKEVQKMLERKITELNSFINNIPDMAWIKDESSRFIEVNSAFAEAVGMDQTALIHQTCEICFGKEKAKEFRDDDLDVMKGVSQKVIEEKIIDSQNKEVWLETVKSPIRDHFGKAIGTVGISRDISKRKKAEERLRQAHDDLEQIVKERTYELKQANEQLIKSAERYTLATKAARVGVWDWNIQNNEFYLDPNVKAILGYSDAEIPNDIETWSNYVHADDKQPVMEAFQDHIDGKTAEFAYKHRMLHKDGTIRWIMARGTAIRDDQGNPIRVIGTDTDITQHQQAEEALREKDTKLEQQSKNLIEMNTALKVLLEQREKEKTGIKENMLANLKKLVIPYIEKLEKTKLNQDSQTFVNIIKSNMNDLISPFAETLSSKYFSLTPSEIQIADLIKHGKTSKEIASILNVSHKAISFHRGNLRKKLGLLNKKVNLRTYLQTFPQ
jgi:PAS domain S-box-containing protein